MTRAQRNRRVAFLNFVISSLIAGGLIGFMVLAAANMMRGAG